MTEPVDPISAALDAAVEQIIAEAQWQADNVEEVDRSALDVRALAGLMAMTRMALGHRRPAERAALEASLAAGDTSFAGCISPRGRPALASFVAGRPIIVVEISELVPADDAI